VYEIGEEQVRCCVESICDVDFSRAMFCFTGSVGRPFPGKG
jgi:hypothetical protein